MNTPGLFHKRMTLSRAGDWYALFLLVGCGFNLHAQIAPTITTQPTSQTNLTGTAVTFSVAVNGTGPFTYQWKFNGTNIPNDLISTVAGNGTGAYAGDGGAATNASLFNPACVAFDALGNFFIADTANNRIRKVDTNGIITTAAGYASLFSPQGVAVDNIGNLYIANTGYPVDGSGSSVIDKVDTNGIVTTVAGNGTLGYSGDGGAATDASLHYPFGVAVDASGNLYIADNYNNRIRKVDTNSIITSVASVLSVGGSGVWNHPSGITFDASGNLFIADSFTERIYKVVQDGLHTNVLNRNNLTLIAGNGSQIYPGTDGGAATNAGLSLPNGVAFNASGNLFIAEYDGNRIRKVDTNGIITTVAGNSVGNYAGDGGAATNASLDAPANVAFDAVGNLYIADEFNNRIREVHLAGFPALSLKKVTVTNAGSYTVVISNVYGSATSTVASLTLAQPPPPLTIIADGANIVLSWPTNATGFTLEWATNLVSPITWLTNSTSPLLIGGENVVTNHICTSQMFFRLTQ